MNSETLVITFSCDVYPNTTYFGDVAQTLLKMMGQSSNVPSAILAEDVQKALEHLQGAIEKLKVESSLKTSSEGDAEQDDRKEKAVTPTHLALPLIELLNEAKSIIEALANGVDPETGEVLSAQSVFNNPQVIRALFIATNALDSFSKREKREKREKTLPGDIYSMLCWNFRFTMRLLGKSTLPLQSCRGNLRIIRHARHFECEYIRRIANERFATYVE